MPKKANVAQLQAQLRNAKLTLERAQTLLRRRPASNRTSIPRSPTERALEAQVAGAQAQLGHVADQSRLHRDPLADRRQDRPHRGDRGQCRHADGRELATIVSQDPMYVIFPVSVRAGLELRERYATKGGFKRGGHQDPAAGRPDLRPDRQARLRLDTIAQNTDTITLRGVVPKPDASGHASRAPAPRELTDGEFVTVLLEGVQPVEVLAIPRAAVLSDQQGDYVYVVERTTRRSPPHSARAVDPDHRRGDQRAQGWREGDRRRPAARPPGPAGVARAGDPGAANSA